jgi:hypothetical protein
MALPALETDKIPFEGLQPVSLAASGELMIVLTINFPDLASGKPLLPLQGIAGVPVLDIGQLFSKGVLDIASTNPTCGCYSNKPFLDI